MYGASYILYGAAHTCMVRAVLYCAHLAIFMQYTGVFPTVAPGCTLCKPDSQLKIDPIVPCTPEQPPAARL